MTITEQIQQRVREALAPEHFELVNESYMHSVPAGSESHFKAIIVSGRFEGQGRVQRQRTVFAALGELTGRIHALTMKTLTPAEWREAGGAVESQSPPCLGGSKADG
ncbi:MAG: BolA family transcriptional regulator [Myxococcales bacterium]|nr:BolA family transcriptional regulator [Myxococcales bacterium]